MQDFLLSLSWLWVSDACAGNRRAFDYDPDKKGRAEAVREAPAIVAKTDALPVLPDHGAVVAQARRPVPRACSGDTLCMVIFCHQCSVNCRSSARLALGG